MPDIAVIDKQRTAKFLYRVAWAIEIVAASVGLFLAIAQIMDASSSNAFNAVLAGIPFFAVAIVELTKIPLASVFYVTENIKWKIIFGIALALAMIITFETFFVGFERYQAVLTESIQTLKNDIQKEKKIIDYANNKDDYAEEKRKELDKSSQSYTAEIATINERFDKLNDEYERRINNINEKYKNDGLKKEIERLTEQINGIEKQRDKEIDIIRTNSDKSIKGLTNNIKDINEDTNSKIKALNEEKQSIRKSNQSRIESINQTATENYKSCVFNCSKHTDKADKLIEELKRAENEEINRINAEISKLSNTPGLAEKISEENKKVTALIDEVNIKFDTQLSSLISTRNQKEKNYAKKSTEKSNSDASELTRLNNAIQENEILRAKEIKEQKNIYSDEQARYNTASAQEALAMEDAAKAEQKYLELCTTLNTKVMDNQIYRLTMQLQNVDNACDLTKEQLSFIQKIWFGSLALVVAGLGTIVALGSFVITTPPQNRKPPKPLGYYFRGIIYRIKKKLKEPKVVIKTVEKDVPVDKIVIKEVEKEVIVEKEVVKEVPVPEVRYVREEVKVPVVEKEYVHIPVYTDDPSKVTWSNKVRTPKKPTKK